MAYAGSVVEREARHVLGAVIRGKHGLSVHKEDSEKNGEKEACCVFCAFRYVSPHV